MGGWGGPARSARLRASSPPPGSGPLFRSVFRPAGPTTVVLTAGHWAPALVGRSTASEVATWLGLDPGADGLESWEVFDAVLEPGDGILMTSWSGEAAAEASQRAVVQRDGTRTRRV